MLKPTDAMADITRDRIPSQKKRVYTLYMREMVRTKHIRKKVQ